MTSKTVYREEIQNFKYINKYMLIKFLIYFYLMDTSIYIYYITSNTNVIHICALIKIPYNIKAKNKLMLFIYFLLIHLCSIYALLLFSNSLKMIKAYRNTSELR